MALIKNNDKKTFRPGYDVAKALEEMFEFFKMDYHAKTHFFKQSTIFEPAALANKAKSRMYKVSEADIIRLAILRFEIDVKQYQKNNEQVKS